MTRKSGWCIDEVQAYDHDRESLARYRHSKCKSETCTCPNHTDREVAAE